MCGITLISLIKIGAIVTLVHCIFMGICVFKPFTRHSHSGQFPNIKLQMERPIIHIGMNILFIMHYVRAVTRCTIRIQSATTVRIPIAKNFKFHRGISIEIDKSPSMGKLRNKQQQQQRKKYRPPSKLIYNFVKWKCVGCTCNKEGQQPPHAINQEI